MTLLENIYAREPLEIRDGIPIFSAPNRYTENYEHISGDHLKSMAQTGQNPWINEDEWLQMERSTAALVTKYADLNAMILDVGVGLGRLLSNFPTMRRFGVDISLAYLREATKKEIEVCYSLIEELPYSDDLFDVVVCTDVLEHVLRLDLCCEKMLSILKPGGYLIVRVPNREDLAPYTSPNMRYEYVHVRRFDENALHLLFEKIFNCEVIEKLPGAFVTAGDRLKCPLPLPYYTRVLGKGLRELRRFSPTVSDNILMQLYYPTEMNIVVRKPKRG